MKYLVTIDDTMKLDGYLTFNSLDGLNDEEVPQNSTLVLHSTSEDEIDASLLLDKLISSNNFSELFYINSSPLNSIKMYVKSVNGVCEEDESVLHDASSLDEFRMLFRNNLVPSISEYKNDLVSFEDNLSILLNLIDDLKNENSNVFKSPMVTTLERLTESLISDKEEDVETIKGLYKFVHDMATNTNKKLDHLKNLVFDSQQSLERVLKQGGNTKRGTQTVISYPSVSYYGTTNVIVFKEYSSCRYLTSFVLAFSGYLQKIKHLRVKVLLVAVETQLAKKRYEPTFMLVNDKNYTKSSSLQSKSTWVTTPTSTIINNQLDLNNEVVLVIDRMYGSESIINNKVNVIHCVRGVLEMNANNLQVSDVIASISSIDLKREVGYLPTVRRYPTTVEKRRDTLAKTYESLFVKLYNNYIKGR